MSIKLHFNIVLIFLNAYLIQKLKILFALNLYATIHSQMRNILNLCAVIGKS